LGSFAVIWAAMLLAICAAVRLPCAQEYVAVPICTQCVYVLRARCHRSCPNWTR